MWGGESLQTDIKVKYRLSQGQIIITKVWKLLNHDKGQKPNFYSQLPGKMHMFFLIILVGYKGLNKSEQGDQTFQSG